MSLPPLDAIPVVRAEILAVVFMFEPHRISSPQAEIGQDSDGHRFRSELF